jgi:UDP-N-acetylglucosamine--N-acetylmuramyl-(pentapeptide) pyrophosphoryl-undecaprenol N-acetylglucosamine transferase
MTTAYIAMAGGHLTQLTELAKRIPPDPGPSLTGGILRWVPRVRTYPQYRHRSGPHRYYGGSGFDAYEPAAGDATFGDRIRVVVIVGTAMELPFTRLMSALVPLLEPAGDLEKVTGRPVDVLWQTGCTPTDGLPLTPPPFVPAADLTAALAPHIPPFTL